MDLPSNPSESTKRRNPNLYRKTEPTSAEAKRLERKKGINKTEQRYLEWLQACGTKWFGVQNITLKIADDCRFTPDFAVFDGVSLRLIDVKAFWKKIGRAHIEDDALVKIKVAAILFPHFRFFVAWEQDGCWIHKEI